MHRHLRCREFFQTIPRKNAFVLWIYTIILVKAKALSSTPATRSCPPESSLYLSDAFPNQAPNADLTLELKVCTIKSESPSPVVHSCHDLEQYVQFLELMEEAYKDGLFVGREEGISIGLERGAYQTELETARKRIARGSQPEDIADVTGLSLLQIKELMAE